MESTTHNYYNRDSSSSSLDHHHHINPARREGDPDGSTRVAGVRYRECMKNHAASTGSHVVDGCGEFMPSGQEGTVESFTCAACNCHRNFHRKHPHHPQPHLLPLSNYYYNSLHRHRHHQHPTFIPPLMVALGGGREDLDVFRSNTAGSEQPKKRFRTKFTEEQKEKMMEFADKLGWKIQKHHDQELRQFCSQVGVKRKVFKVWMHNNKQAKKQQQV
ncbi:zinc-finger homeodomain protein 6 [Senna tora]|uniref:Zinc-finger homeodomain protein 6 n=1 Tax=Senna tora TaxID=362788 RepID=A0A834W4U1_9FABA|nr:zinc-finger homeodomain protein 6 [Senna tora]